MNAPESPASVQPEPHPLHEGVDRPARPHEEVAAEICRLESEAKVRKEAARMLRPLSKVEAVSDLEKFEQKLAALRKALEEDLVAECRLHPLLDHLREYLETAGQRIRKQLGRELQAACKAAGLEMHVVSQEDPVELRVPPLAVVLDFRRGTAELRFARQVLRNCPATVEEIVGAHRSAMRELDREFDPREFFKLCWIAYRMTLVAQGLKNGERVELNDFLANLAVRMQPRKFFVDPVAQNFRGYSRAQFAYDVLRLRKARGLTCEGRRINFGVATGTTASSKNRVLYLEDDAGKGEYKLTIYFTEA